MKSNFYLIRSQRGSQRMDRAIHALTMLDYWTPRRSGEWVELYKNGKLIIERTVK